jgi:hypothetical protein
MIDISIIIVTYNPGDIVLQALASIPAAVGDLAYEIIVVDNGSQDGTPEKITRADKHIQIIRAENRGFAAGNNLGLAVARGRYPLLMNPDVIAAPKAFQEMAGFMDANLPVGIVAPRMLDGDGHVALSGFGTYTPLSVLWNFLGLARLFPDMVWGKYGQQCRSASASFFVEWVSGACMLIRRAVYEKIGGLDEAFFLFCEEPDYCDRALRAGWRIAVFPTARVIHHESSTISRYPLIKMRHYHRSPMVYFRKRKREGAVWILRLGFTLELVSKWLIRAVQTLIRPTSSNKSKLKAYPSVLNEVWRF